MMSIYVTSLSTAGGEIMMKRLIYVTSLSTTEGEIMIRGQYM